ncbi:MAG: hypothetical protein ACI3VJ_05680, partial [Hominicoprocola sp.]
FIRLIACIYKAILRCCPKYITKSMASMAALKGVHTYYHSRGLNKAVVVGWQFVPNSLLDKCCKYKNSFYATGFCKFDYVAEIAVELEELTDMFLSRYIWQKGNTTLKLRLQGRACAFILTLAGIAARRGMPNKPDVANDKRERQRKKAQCAFRRCFFR